MSPRPKLEHLRKPQIVAAAAEVMYERGLFETRIGDIAERAGTSSATILYYFESKDRLLEEAVDHADREWYTRLSARLDRCASATEKLVRLVEDTSLGNGELGDWTLWLEMWVRARRDPHVRASYPRLDRRQRSLIAGIVREGQDAGEFSTDADPDDVALDLSALMDGLGIQVTLGQPDVSRRRMVRRCLAIASLELGCELRPAAALTGRSARETDGPALGAQVRRARRDRPERGGLLGACADSTTPVGAIAADADVGPGGLPLARPNRPVTLPIHHDNPPIASGLRPEAGPLQFYNWIAYINPDVVTDFEKKYKVKVQISTFNTIDEAVAKLASGAVQFDVFVPETVFLEQLVVGKILQPLNHSYLPNLAANVWPSLADPGTTSAAATPSRTRSTRPALDGGPTSYRDSIRRSSGTRGPRCGGRARGSPARSGCSTTSTTA